ncbi:dopamine beta-hydroxylase-like [Physella acuta]|uniref:dopamine beta-hydroxylase-like n=1 Tax=Physella acuta TaxID=109671 RepID=UPI0027DC25E9|nr:dopamine beta-hydroxylase-like [Physella acuta]
MSPFSHKSSLGSLVCLALLQWACTYRVYKSKIPNGDAVPFPCKPNHLWEGVGHMLDQGTGVQNLFGSDFKAAGHAWTAELCRKDSDGDGMTNGQELGDPDCTWTENSIPKRTTGLSHPGICDPWDSPSCLAKPVVHAVYKTQADWMREECKAQDFICAGKEEQGVKNVSVQLPKGSHVPVKETTYMCKIFDLEKMMPPDDYHMVAVEPVIDNVNVLHHMVLFGCKDKEQASDSAFECGMTASKNCQDFLSVWTVGFAGDCSHPNAGVRIGVNGYKRVAIQVHWNNPEKKTNWTDSSGLKLYYTPKRRPYDAGIILTGSNWFVLPPRAPEVTVKGTCTKACTSRYYKGAVQITMAWNHMHYAGIKMKMEVLRDNKHLTYLTNDPEYSYDSPQAYHYTDNPVLLLPGDEIVTTCTYTTAKLDHSVLQGDATSEEMCFGFITYFPKMNVSHEYCMSYGPDVSFCDWTTWAKHDCKDHVSLLNASALNASSFYHDLQAKCRPFGPCLQECAQYVLQQARSNGCLRGQMYEVMQNVVLNKYAEGRNIMALIASCQTEVYLAMNGSPMATTKRGLAAAVSLQVVLVPVLMLLF